MKEKIIFTSFGNELVLELNLHNISYRPFPEPDKWLDKLGIDDEEERKWLIELTKSTTHLVKYIVSEQDYNYLRLVEPKKFIMLREDKLYYYPNNGIR